MAAPFRGRDAVKVGAPRALFTTAPPWSDFDVDEAGRFLAVVTESRSTEQPLTIVLDWTSALDR